MSEDVRGVIIGSYFYHGQLYYDGRPQGVRLSADTEDALLERACQLKHRLIDENRMVSHLYRDNALWQLKIYA
jgi:hypothetical protein